MHNFQSYFSKIFPRNMTLTMRWMHKSPFFPIMHAKRCIFPHSAHKVQFLPKSTQKVHFCGKNTMLKGWSPARMQTSITWLFIVHKCLQTLNTASLSLMNNCLMFAKTVLSVRNVSVWLGCSLQTHRKITESSHCEKPNSRKAHSKLTVNSSCEHTVS